MNKLTIEIARRDIGHLREHQANPKVGLSMREELYLQALEKALPVLAAQEDASKFGTGFVICHPDHPPHRADPLRVTISFTNSDTGTVQPQTATNPQIENDGWIEWGGGDCPVEDDAVIEIKLRNGEFINNLSDTKILIWVDRGMDTDIIAFRVIENDGREG